MHNKGIRVFHRDFQRVNSTVKGIERLPRGLQDEAIALILFTLSPFHEKMVAVEIHKKILL